MIYEVLIFGLQITALYVYGTFTLEVARKQSLSKNFPWVLQNQQFAKCYDKPDRRPLFLLCLVSIIVVTVLIMSRQSLGIVNNGRNFGFLGALLVLHLYSYFVEKQLKKKIPLLEKRTATLIKRTVGQYVSHNRLKLAVLVELFVISAITISFLINLISFTTFILHMWAALFCYALLYGGMFWVVNEKIPHQNQTEMVSKEMLSENYRRFTLNLQNVTQFVVSGLILFHLSLSFFNYRLVTDSFVNKVYERFGESSVPVSLLTVQQTEMAAAIFLVLFMFFIARSKPYRDILAVSVITEESMGGMDTVCD